MGICSNKIKCDYLNSCLLEVVCSYKVCIEIFTVTEPEYSIPVSEKPTILFRPEPVHNYAHSSSKNCFNVTH